METYYYKVEVGASQDTKRSITAERVTEYEEPKKFCGITIGHVTCKRERRIGYYETTADALLAIAEDDRRIKEAHALSDASKLTVGVEI